MPPHHCALCAFAKQHRDTLTHPHRLCGRYFADHQTDNTTALCNFLSGVLFVLGRRDATVWSVAQALRYLHFTPMVAQMAHATDVRTTDTQLRMLSNNPNATVQVGDGAAIRVWCCALSRPSPLADRCHPTTLPLTRRCCSW